MFSHCLRLRLRRHFTCHESRTAKPSAAANAAIELRLPATPPVGRVARLGALTARHAMLCEQCQEREATNHITSFIGDVKHTRGVCNECLESSGTPEAECAASMRAARCDFCGAPANLGGTDHLALCVGEQRFSHQCFSCSEEFNRYTGAAMERMPGGLSQEQQLDAIRQLRQDADRHMRDWLSRRAQ